ncbi:uncharacterized protein G2W53_010767 [Senna tora]|uniref:Uncharacterized protein n=1 Tax=Senna tora TaxID=362788 RepID=A0A834X0I1_9FABA|nr:uncharacterized protein G2W53_010767 [Senna tora]
MEVDHKPTGVEEEWAIKCTIITP